MPAIAVYGRLETHLSDAELAALHRLTRHLIQGAYNGAQSLFLDAADGDAAMSGDMLSSTVHLHAAAARVMRERSLLL
ncbi:hypothetical protein [Bordetella avium]|uniref:hypothetical protein n=1 Tax=Bordetella avium TaxID=521 RepID=UPI000FD808EE|nr:hypothetical protein [Bordetella avium]AZY53278.1 hypothetical protein C0J07_12920 [Bordetella avium]